MRERRFTEAQRTGLSAICDPKIKVYVDTMFAEGLLKAARRCPSKYENRGGNRIDSERSSQIRFKKLSRS